MSGPPVDVFDAAIVLGARLGEDGTPSPAMVRRVALGVQMVRQGRAGALLLTGGDTGAGLSEARAMAVLAQRGGVAPECLMLEERSRNTIENARFSAPLVADAGWRRLVVVTDSFHCPRAAYVFRRVGLTVALAGVRPAAPSFRWWLAHLREAAALPWTVLRVEAARLRAQAARMR